MRRVSWILTLPIMLVVVVFAVTNRQMVTLDLWPLEMSITVPLFVAMLGGLFAGVLAGGIAVWLSGGRTRRRARQTQRRVAELEREAARLRRAQDPARDPRPSPSAGGPGHPVAAEGERRSGQGNNLTAVGA